MKIIQRKIILQSIIQQGWWTSKSGVALRILGVAPTEGEKYVALKVGETAASHLTPLHVPGLVTRRSSRAEKYNILRIKQNI